MILIWSPKSPFVRKVMILAHELGIAEALELRREVAVPRGMPNPAILAVNPLGKIPALIRDAGPALIGSAAILDYLCEITPGGRALLPASGEARVVQLRWQALADQLTEVLLDWRIAATGPQGIDAARRLSFEAKVRAGMALFEAEAPLLRAAPFGPGPIALICALGQLDFRYPDCGWREAFPALARFAADTALRPSVAVTAIVNDQGDSGPDLQLTFE